MGGPLSTEFVIGKDTIFRVNNDGATMFTIDHRQNRRPESVNVRIGIALKSTSNALRESSRLLR